MKALKYAETQEEKDRIEEYRKSNLERALNNPNENRVYDRIKQIEYKAGREMRKIVWYRQYVLGYRIFDFYDPIFRIAVEVDGTEHNQDYDYYRDEYNFRAERIVVLRIRNGNKEDLDYLVSFIPKLFSAKERKRFMSSTGFVDSHNPIGRKNFASKTEFKKGQYYLGKFLASVGYQSQYQIFTDVKFEPALTKEFTIVQEFVGLLKSCAIRVKKQASGCFRVGHAKYKTFEIYPDLSWVRLWDGKKGAGFDEIIDSLRVERACGWHKIDLSLLENFK